MLSFNTLVSNGRSGRRALGRQVARMTAAINYLPLDGCSDEWQQRARSTHSPVMEADLQMVCRLHGSNLRDTGHSFEAGPMTAKADYVDPAIMESGGFAPPWKPHIQGDFKGVMTSCST